MSTAVLVTLLICLAVGGVRAQVQTRSVDGDLRVESTDSEDRRGRPVMSGYVYNQRAGSYAISVRLRVEALDGAGQVVGSTIGYVLGDVPPSNRSYFEIKAPARAASYRVTIESFAWRAYGAGGG
ncbi:MAG TPA: hypothetical protein VKA83_28325 [Methylomirabilota bacterium]|nr:hypothetical protein [Methylomirabilota bacterium]